MSFANTRSYHGLLVSSINERHDRWVMLSKLFEIFENKGVKFSLDTNYYPNTIY
ncbi:MAG: glycogen debranching enzyme N-terminal domain-containing protein, partial [Candidatus Thermoplasmatota archaeon]|nr:glycogen debranching enzyme N-terminal domain-containing protein [Candidatus Thermoplasmatota archaeon]